MRAIGGIGVVVVLSGALIGGPGVAGAQRLSVPSAPSAVPAPASERLPAVPAVAPPLVPGRVAAGAALPEWLRMYQPPAGLPPAPAEDPLPARLFNAPPPNLTPCTASDYGSEAGVFVVDKQVNGVSVSCTIGTYGPPISVTSDRMQAVAINYWYYFVPQTRLTVGRTTGISGQGGVSFTEDSYNCGGTFDQTISTIESDRTDSISAFEASIVRDCGDTKYFARVKWARPPLGGVTSCTAGNGVAMAQERDTGGSIPVRFCERGNRVGSARIEGSRLVVQYLAPSYLSPQYGVSDQTLETVVFEFPPGTAPSTGPRWVTPTSVVKLYSTYQPANWARFEISHLVVDRWGTVTELDAKYVRSDYFDLAREFNGSLHLRSREVRADSSCMTWTPADPSANYLVVDASFNAEAGYGQCQQSAQMGYATFDGTFLFVVMGPTFTYGSNILRVAFPGTVGTFVDDEFEKRVELPVTRPMVSTLMGDRCLAPTGTFTVTRFEMGVGDQVRALDATLEQRCFERPPLFAKVHVDQPAA